MSDRRRSKLAVFVAAVSKSHRSKFQVFAAAVGIAVTLVGVLVVSAPRSEAAFDAFIRFTVCHATVDGTYNQMSLMSPGGHEGHKEDVILPPLSECPDKVASPGR